ncbi:MAG: phosphatidylserine/phosphatidylglycerophosphate/cardiolipin synthase family protein, partial [bacterium]|nr:phosphatidylserine/phosphatidylglycerophosphate/cardiolipin synthase family protein [bacterium]
GDDVFNRYDFVHTKFVIVDGEWLAISSQNFSNSSMPSDDKSNGTYGSRGVVLATNAPAVVARAAEVFGRDLDPAYHNDVLRWNTNPSYIAKYGPPDPAFEPTLVCADHTTYTVQFPEPLAVNGEFGFELFTAPEAALRRSDALLGLVSRAGAGDVVYVEQLYEHVDWGDDPGGDPNLRLEAYITAARRGASVRILLNSGTFGQDYYENTNVETVAYVRQIARAEGLD